MKLFLANINDVQPESISRISPERAEKAKRYRKIDDRKRCIAGGLLIKQFLKNAVITYNEFGKPVADNGMHFNLSHSGDYVLLALSDCEIGCDIEKVRSVNAEKAGRIVFCENEMNKITSSFDKTDTFLELWTKKESLLKCMGKGFHRNSKSVDVSGDSFEENGRIYYLKTWKFSDYIISACSFTNEFPNYIEFADLTE